MPTASTRDTLLRQWHVLSLLPRHPLALTVETIRHRLAGEGFAVTRRTIERDLQKLSIAGFPLGCDTVDGLHHWSLVSAPARWISTLPSVTDAVLLLMARDYVSPLLPPLMRRALAPTFDQAERVLRTARATNHLARWRDKVRAALPTQTLLAPRVPEAIHEACTDALLRERQLAVSYESRSRSARQALTLNPLALVQRGLVSYLVATAAPHTDPRLYALHRVRTARVLGTALVPPPDFGLETFLANGFVDFGRGRQIRVRLRVSPSVAAHLSECRLSEDQRITRTSTPRDWYRVTATVNDTPQLRWWIRGFGADIKAASPDLRERHPGTAGSGSRARRR